MTNPENLFYTESHEWILKEADGTATVGITDHAQALLGDLVFIDLPETDQSVDAGDDICVVESVKAASDVYAPLSGTISAVNDALDDAPELINEAAFSHWIFKMTDVNWDGVDLMDAKAYANLIAETDG